jgi:hypothetical protein
MHIVQREVRCKSRAGHVTINKPTRQLPIYLRLASCPHAATAHGPLSFSASLLHHPLHPFPSRCHHHHISRLHDSAGFSLKDDGLRGAGHHREDPWSGRSMRYVVVCHPSPGSDIPPLPLRDRIWYMYVPNLGWPGKPLCHAPWTMANLSLQAQPQPSLMDDRRRSRDTDADAA